MSENLDNIKDKTLLERDGGTQVYADEQACGTQVYKDKRACGTQAYEEGRGGSLIAERGEADDSRVAETARDESRLAMFEDSDGKVNMTDDQKQAVLKSGKIIVSAAAGSGKTYALIKRILLMVAEGASMRDMLICVYNDSTQAELRQRLHNELFSLAVSETDGVRRDRFRAALDMLPFCRISTIHSFCASLIRENFEKLGISPVFEVCDSARFEAMKSAAISEVFNEYSESGDADFAVLSDVFAQKRSDEGLRDITSRLYDNLVMRSDRESYKRDALADFENSRLHGDLAERYKRLLRDAKKRVEGVFKYAADSRMLAFNKYDATAVGEKQVIDELLSKESFYEMCKCAAEILGDFSSRIVKGTKQQKKFFTQEDIYNMGLADKFANSIKLILKELANFYTNWDLYRERHPQSVRFTAKLIEMAERVDEKLTARMREKNLLGYQDLLILADRLLSEDGGAEIGAEYKIIFVDEYQDVDPLQEAIFQKLIKGECFMVGDVKQSIYGFRLADPKIFMSRMERYGAGEGTVIGFNKNFRSEAAILDFVNGVFDSAMTENSADVDYLRDGKFTIEDEAGGREQSDAEAEGDDPRATESADRLENAVSLTLFAGAENAEASKKPPFEGIYDIASDIPEVKNTEASDADRQAYFILKEIKRIVGRKKKKNGDYVSYGDIAILHRKNQNKSKTLARIIEVLKEGGVPVDDSKVGSEHAYVERELVLFLRALDNPRQDIPFAGYLLSYFGGYSEQELADITAYGGECYYDRFVAASNGEDALASKARDTLASLKAYRLKASVKTVGELIQDIVSDYNYDAYMLGKGEGNLYALNSFMSSAAAEDSSLGSFLESYTKENGSSVSASGDSVQISTYHKYKGLEIPIVFLPDLARAFTVKDMNVGISPLGMIGIKYCDLDNRTLADSFAMDAVKALVKERDVKEEMRLLYVALTRAREALYILSPVTKTHGFGNEAHLQGVGNMLDFLSDAALYRTLTVEPVIDSSVAVSEIEEHAPVMAVVPDVGTLERVRAARRDFNYAHFEATTLSRKYSASSLNSLGEQSVGLYSDRGEAAKRGTAYHIVMQHIDLFKDELADVEAELDAMLDRGVLTKEEREIVDANYILRCLKSDVVKMAREALTAPADKGYACMREKPFMMLKPANEISDAFKSSDKVLVQGVIDMYIRGEERVIVDFKYSEPSDEEIRQKYKKQLHLYKMAVEAAENANIDKICLYYFKTGKCETIE